MTVAIRTGADAGTSTPVEEEPRSTSIYSVSPRQVAVENRPDEVPPLDGWDDIEPPDFDLPSDADAEVPTIPVEVADRAAARWVTIASRLTDVHDRAETQLVELRALYEERKALIEEWAQRRADVLLADLEYCERLLAAHSEQHLAERGWKALSLSYPAGVTAAFRAGNGTLRVDDPAAFAAWLEAEGAGRLVTRQVKVTIDTGRAKALIKEEMPKLEPGQLGDQYAERPGAVYERTAYSAQVKGPRS